MRIAILAFSPLASDARILRQVQALRPKHEVMLAGEPPAPAGRPGGNSITAHAAGIPSVGATGRNETQHLLIEATAILKPQGREDFAVTCAGRRPCLEALRAQA